jgi:16S rRNA (adenine1518-N6/adenine1519-N6)-dimethyltransferase
VARLVAVEIDQGLAQDLEREFADGTDRVRIVRGDALAIDLDRLLRDAGASEETPARVLANLPYNVASAILLRLIAHRTLLSDLLVMVQREVAARIASPPGRKTYGGLSVLCQAHARVETVLRLRPGSFRPVPKVDSEMVRLTFLPRDAAPDTEGLERLLRAAFAARRKTLQNNLAALDGLGAAGAERLVRAAGLDPRQRPEQVPVASWLELLRRRRSIIRP